jgi:hypothetical protein
MEKRQRRGINSGERLYKERLGERADGLRRAARTET